MKRYSLLQARRLVTGTSDWRQAVWNRWLVGYLTPKGDDFTPENAPATGVGPTQEKEVSAAAEAAPDPTSDSFSEGAPSATVSREPGGEVFSDPTLGVVTEERSRRRTEALRARLDRMLEQMDVLEVTVDRIAERQSVAASHDRLQLRSVTDLLDRLVESQERHTETLVHCMRAVVRLERRMVAFERGFKSGGGDLMDSVEPRGRDPVVLESMMAPSRSHEVPVKGRRGVPESAASSDPHAPLGGKLSDISLSTILSMAELERWTGRLTIEAETHTIQVDLESGLLVGVLEDDSPSDAIEALYDLIDEREGRFSFAPSESVVRTELGPMTVGTLLLRASHRRDELERAEVGS